MLIADCFFLQELWIPAFLLQEFEE
jgi:hypothetical protein